MSPAAARLPTEPDGGAGSAGGTDSAFRHMQARLATLARDFGLGAEASVMLAAYDALFHRALAFPLGRPPPGASRLAEDGTPIQFATTVGAAMPALRFVGDPGPPGATGALRISAARTALAEVADVLGLAADLAAIAPLLETLVPQTARALLEDPAGSLWIGAAFAPGAAPVLRIYLNGRWGSGASARARLGTFAAHFGHAAAWTEAEQRMPAGLDPIGLALTLGSGRPVRGAIYLRAFGLRLTDYAFLTEVLCGPANAARIDRFGTALLGPDSPHPTPSAVFSLGLSAGARPVAELEFCAHCLFRDEAEAERRIMALFSAEGLDPAPYLSLLRQMSLGDRRPGPPRLHAFAGVDAKAAGRAYTLYLKPDFAGYR